MNFSAMPNLKCQQILRRLPAQVNGSLPRIRASRSVFTPRVQLSSSRIKCGIPARGYTPTTGSLGSLEQVTGNFTQFALNHVNRSVGIDDMHRIAHDPCFRQKTLP